MKRYAYIATIEQAEHRNRERRNPEKQHSKHGTAATGSEEPPERHYAGIQNLGERTLSANRILSTASPVAFDELRIGTKEHKFPDEYCGQSTEDTLNVIHDARRIICVSVLA